MPRQYWRFPCCVDKGIASTESKCSRCKRDGVFDGWQLTMHEAMSRYQYVYGLKPLGPHRPMADELLGALRAECRDCQGRGVAAGPTEATWALCATCEGTGGFWRVDEHEVAVRRARVLQMFPDAGAPVQRLDFASPGLAHDLNTGLMDDLAPCRSERDRRFPSRSESPVEDDLTPISLPPEVQNSVDQLLAGFDGTDDRLKHPTFQRVTDWLEEHENELGIRAASSVRASKR